MLLTGCWSAGCLPYRRPPLTFTYRNSPHNWSSSALPTQISATWFLLKPYVQHVDHDFTLCMKINNNNNNNKIKTVKLKQITLDNVSIYTLFGGSKSLARVCWNFHGSPAWIGSCHWFRSWFQSKMASFNTINAFSCSYFIACSEQQNINMWGDHQLRISRSFLKYCWEI